MSRAGHVPPPGAGAIPPAADGCTPPSAAGHLEPYGARVTLRAEGQPLDLRPFLTTLVEDLAASCVAAGASVIGHIKCLLRTPDGVLTCNLTSVRTGASVRGQAHTNGAAVLRIGESAEMEIAVLVYDLSAEAIDALLEEGLHRLLGPSGASWSKQAYFERR